MADELAHEFGNGSRTDFSAGRTAQEIDAQVCLFQKTKLSVTRSGARRSFEGAYAVQDGFRTD